MNGLLQHFRMKSEMYWFIRSYHRQLDHRLKIPPIFICIVIFIVGSTMTLGSTIFYISIIHGTWYLTQEIITLAAIFIFAILMMPIIKWYYTDPSIKSTKQLQYIQYGVFSTTVQTMFLIAHMIGDELMAQGKMTEAERVIFDARLEEYLNTI